MTPARHNIVHVSKQHSIQIDVECFANGTLARFVDGAGRPVALVFDNRAAYNEIEARILAARRGVRPPMAVRPEHRASRASLAKLAALCSGADGVYTELDAAPATIIHELSLTKGLELVLHPDGRVTWQRMGSDE